MEVASPRKCSSHDGRILHFFQSKITIAINNTTAKQIEAVKIFINSQSMVKVPGSHSNALELLRRRRNRDILAYGR